MNKFSWYEAASVNDALQQVTQTVSEALYNGSEEAAIIKSGGVDVLDLIKEGLVRPEKIVNIRNIPGLDKIEFDPKKGLRIGSNASLAAIEGNPAVQKHYHALHEAIAHAATPQLRNMSTLGGNLAQRNRCWYFRSLDHNCFRKGGAMCFARNEDKGQNENHAILNNGTCVSVHASSIATALMAFGAKVGIINAKGQEREVAMDDFFVAPGEDVSKETVLEAQEIITHVSVPAPGKNTRSAYIKQVARESYDWSLADVAVVAEVSGTTCKQASIVLGSAAPVPHRATEAERALLNQKINEKTAKAAGLAAMEKARPLSQNGYKVPLFVSIIQRAITQLA